MRGSGKTMTRAIYQGYKARMQVFDDEENDPMNTRNNVVARAHITKEVLCAVLKDEQTVHFENRMGFNGAEYARQAFQKFGKCRVIFYEANDAQTWRELRWKNANVGTMYRRPSFINLLKEKVPQNLQLAAMLL